VLATFRLSNPGWDIFCQHFDEKSQTRTSVLTQAQMAPYHSQEDGGGHAVVLVGCSPNSLTFLNSWGGSWGDNGSFSIDKHTVLGQDDAAMNFYDVYWLESDLTSVERQAYNTKVDEELRRRAKEHPSIFELEYQCPECRENAPLAEFRGNIRIAICPNCEESFEAEAGQLVQALYLRAGLSDVV
jgi:transcription elongation factor Elf1